MKRSLLSALALGCCWMFSPESLALIGNLAGQAGWAIFPPFALITLCFMICAALLTHQDLPAYDFPAQNNKAFFSILISTLTFAAILPLTIISATALLVTAGYAFNEVFLYWFPNFGFAFLLLGLLTGLQFFTEKIKLGAQVFFIGITMLGLLTLSAYGIFLSSPNIMVTTLADQGRASSTSFFPWQVLIFLPLVYVGTLFPGERHNRAGTILIPAIGFVLFLIWVAASLNNVTLERLASSGIPHMTTARKILGNPGRYIMGVIVIAGSCGAVNGFFILCQRMLTDPLSKHKEKAYTNPQLFLPVLLAACIGVAMATGLAGEALLENLLRAALFLWLLYMVARCIAALFWLYRQKGLVPIPALLSTLALSIVLIGLPLGDPEQQQLILCILSALSAGMLIAICQFFINTSARKEKTT
uniref:hypothetical protein n=1 Tax=Candidatus Electrothrix sp. TaxID=2170559 RepID=UPI0040572664